MLRRTVRREKLLELIAQLPACLIGMEACTGAHEWARQFGQFGHTVRLMAPKFVAPYRKSGKNDDNDAEAICEAVARPNMRFVPLEDDRATGGARPASHPPGLHRGGAPQPQSHPRSARGVWPGAAAALK